MKVAIITHYYNSINYGGNLQAFALCKCLSNLGITAEQLAYDRFGQRNFLRSLRKIAGKSIRYLRTAKSWSVKNNIDKRTQKILAFNKGIIPHSKTVYTPDTISGCIAEYDAFITGSDQVWHPIAYCSAYGLEFVPSSKIKISYAASIACDQVSNEHLAVLQRSLSDFCGISVRESAAVQLLQAVAPQPIHVSLDPTLLLSREEWDEICGERRVLDPYVFCYYLGNDKIQRELATEYAKKYGLKVVTLPYLLDENIKNDRKFGDIKIFDASPADFISLVKHAAVVFTDSFHAAVFSGIYQKQFVVFDRSVRGSMGSRIVGLMELFGTEDRFCDTENRRTMEYLESLPAITYGGTFEKLTHMQTESITYLQDHLLKKKNES